MLACAPGPAGVTLFPVMATPKIDGIRAIMVQGKLSSRTLKPIPNVAVRTALESVLPDGSDGELMYGTTFQDCTSAVMTKDGPRSAFTYYAFDLVPDVKLDRLAPYTDRIERLSLLMKQPDRLKQLRSISDIVEVIVLVPTLVSSAAALSILEKSVLAKGFEGLIVRAPGGKYKFGRSTAKEGLMLKVKHFEDAEGTVQGSEELVHATSPNRAPSNLLGTLVVVRPDGVQFRIGSGFSAAQRRELWKKRASLVGKIVKYKFFPIGIKEAPRFPTFQGFRDKADM